MTAEQSHRFALTGADREGRNRTIILWRESDLIDGRVVHRVVIAVDATTNTATVLTRIEGKHSALGWGLTGQTSQGLSCQAATC